MKLNYKKQYRVELAKTLSGHFYSVWEKGKKKEKFLGHYPSVTTYLNAFPTSEQLMKWMAEQGFHESRAIRDAAGRAGTKIHLAIEDLMKGEELQESMYTTEEWVKIKSFVDWHARYKPEVLATELPIFSKKGEYAGTVDCIAKISGEMYVLDWKSSRSIHETAYLQVAAYASAIEEQTDLKIISTGIVQLGARNKDGFRFAVSNDWKEQYKVFEHVRDTWKYALQTKESPVLVLPPVLKLNL